MNVLQEATLSDWVVVNSIEEGRWESDWLQASPGTYYWSVLQEQPRI